MRRNSLVTHFPLRDELPAGVQFWWAGGRSGSQIRSFDWSDSGQRTLRSLAAEIDVATITRMRQVHGSHCQEVQQVCSEIPDSDACVSRLAGGYGVMTADCLPLLACDGDGSQVGVAHAGWRGLAAGILPNWIGAFSAAAQSLSVWIGPAICHQCFQIGSDVVRAFEQAPAFEMIDIGPHIQPDSDEVGKYYLNLKQLAAVQLRALGVKRLVLSDLCTRCEPTLHSFRRDTTPFRLLCGVTKKNPT